VSECERWAKPVVRTDGGPKSSGPKCEVTYAVPAVETKRHTAQRDWKREKRTDPLTPVPGLREEFSCLPRRPPLME